MMFEVCLGIAALLAVTTTLLMVRALVAPVAWWRALAGPLVIPCLAWCVGSLVQRQMIAIVQLRLRRPC